MDQSCIPCAVWNSTWGTEIGECILHEVLQFSRRLLNTLKLRAQERRYQKHCYTTAALALPLHPERHQALKHRGGSTGLQNCCQVCKPLECHYNVTHSRELRWSGCHHSVLQRQASSNGGRFCDSFLLQLWKHKVFALSRQTRLVWLQSTPPRGQGLAENVWCGNLE